MAYVDRMSWRMLGRALVLLALGGVAAWLSSALLGLPHLFGGQPCFPDLSFDIFMVGAGAVVSISTYQILRLWRWTRGKGAVCYGCGCLLGGRRMSRTAPIGNALVAGRTTPYQQALSEVVVDPARRGHDGGTLTLSGEA